MCIGSMAYFHTNWGQRVTWSTLKLIWIQIDDPDQDLTEKTKALFLGFSSMPGYGVEIIKITCLCVITSTFHDIIY